MWVPPLASGGMTAVESDMWIKGSDPIVPGLSLTLNKTRGKSRATNETDRLVYRSKVTLLSPMVGTLVPGTDCKLEAEV